MRIYVLQSFIKTAAAGALSLVFAVFAAMLSDCKGEGLAGNADVARREYYLYSTSSQAEIKGNISVSDLPFIEGESVCISFQNESDAEKFCETLLKEKRAAVRFEERIGDTVSFYAYTTRGGVGILLKGYEINLHVARRGNSVCVGTPIVFGGY